MKLEMRVCVPTLSVVTVPENYRECSICGRWKPFESYCNDMGYLCRTNCKECYYMPLDDMTALKAKVQAFKEEHKHEIRRLESDIYVRKECMTKKEFLQDIERQLADVGDDELIHPIVDTYDCEGASTKESLMDLSITVERKVMHLDKKIDYTGVVMCY